MTSVDPINTSGFYHKTRMCKSMTSAMESIQEKQKCFWVVCFVCVACVCLFLPSHYSSIQLPGCFDFALFFFFPMMLYVRRK